MSRRLPLLLALVALVALGFSARAAELPAGVHLPLPVHLSMRLLDITRVSETAGEISATVEYSLTWKDPAEGFDPQQTGVYRLDFAGPDADARLKTLWTPGVTIENRIGEPRLRSTAVSILSDGTVRLLERIDADFRLGFDLSAFPFDTQRLPLAFVMPRFSADRAVFVVDDRDRDLSSVAPALSAGDWSPAGLSFTLTRFYGWNARPFAKATAIAGIAREWPRYLLRIFVPFAAVISVSLFILWAPDHLVNDRPGIVYSALLALAALSFTYEASFPGSMSVNSPIAFMISLGYFYLIFTLLANLLLKHAPFPGRRSYPALEAAVHDNIRLSLPAIFTLVSACAILRALV